MPEQCPTAAADRMFGVRGRHGALAFVSECRCLSLVASQLFVCYVPVYGCLCDVSFAIVVLRDDRVKIT